MCSELFRIPYVWGGVPMFGFGVLLAVWAVASAVALGVQARRHGWTTETWSYIPLLGLVGAAILFLPRLFPDGLPIRGYGVMVLLGATSGVGLAVYRARQAGLHHDLILSLAFWMFICGIIGARFFYVIEYWEYRFSGRGFFGTIKEILRYTEGGLVIYGALIGATVAFFWFVRKHKLPVLAMADMIAPSLVIGLAFGRLGCLLNGCCYGGPSEHPWAVTFPPASPPYQEQVAHGDMLGFHLAADNMYRPVVASVVSNSPAAKAGVKSGDVIAGVNGRSTPAFDQAAVALVEAAAAHESVSLQVVGGGKLEIPAGELPPRSRPVHPTQIYSAINAGLLCWFLWSYYPFRRRDGEVVALLLTIYPITRFLLEILRTDESPVFGTGMSISQNISLAVFVGAIGLWLYLAGRPRLRAWDGGLRTAAS